MNLNLSYTHLPLLGSTAVINELGEERVYVVYLMVIVHWESQSRNSRQELKRRPWKNAAYWFTPMTCSGVAPPTRLGPPISVIKSGKCPIDLLTGQSFGGIFSTRNLFFKIFLGSYPIDRNHQQNIYLYFLKLNLWLALQFSRICIVMIWGTYRPKAFHIG